MKQMDSASDLPAKLEALRHVVARLSEQLNEENAILEAGKSGEHGRFVLSKNQLLKELMALQRTVKPEELPPETLGELAAARKLVDRNHSLLNMQVQALRDVTKYLTDSAVQRMGDGTYSRRQA